MKHKRKIKLMYHVEIACYVTGVALLIMPLLFTLLLSLGTSSSAAEAVDGGINKWIFIVFAIVLFADGFFLRRNREKLIAEEDSGVEE